MSTDTKPDYMPSFPLLPVLIMAEDTKLDCMPPFPILLSSIKSIKRLSLTACPLFLYATYKVSRD